MMCYAGPALPDYNGMQLQENASYESITEMRLVKSLYDVFQTCAAHTFINEDICCYCTVHTLLFAHRHVEVGQKTYDHEV